MKVSSVLTSSVPVQAWLQRPCLRLGLYPTLSNTSPPRVLASKLTISSACIENGDVSDQDHLSGLIPSTVVCIIRRLSSMCMFTENSHIAARFKLLDVDS